jgi:hypothetical protein
MRDELRGLPGKHEVLPGLLLPAADRFWRWRPVKHAIQLSALKLTGIVLEL